MRAHEILLELAKTTINSTGRVIASDPEAIERFWAWFRSSKVKDKEGRPLVVYHGTQTDFRAFDPQKSNSHTKTGTPTGAFVFTDSSDVATTYLTVDGHKKDFETPELRQQYKELIQQGSFEAQLQFLYDHPLVPAPEYDPGGNVLPVYLRITTPLIVDAKGYHWDEVYFKPTEYREAESFTTNEIAAYAMQNGYDGAIIRNVRDVHTGPAIESTIYFVFSANQIKSAIANNGTYGDAPEIDESEY